MKKAMGVIHGLKKIAYKRLKQAGKTGLLFLLVIALTASPLSSVAAGLNTADPRSESVFGTIFGAVRAHMQGEAPAGQAMPGEELAAALAALDDFTLLVLKDPRLSTALDEIILDLLEDEGTVEGIQEKKEFVAGILRDPRLSATLGDIITGYLRDERLAEDIEQLFGVVFDLITNEDLHYFLRDALASLVEDPRLENTVNGLLTEVVGTAHDTGTEALADLVTDDQIPLFITDLVSIMLSPLPDLLTLTYDERVRLLSADLLEILVEHEMEQAVSLVENEDLKAVVADLLLLLAEPVAGATAEIGLGLVEQTVPGAARGLADGTIDDVLDEMVDHLFKHQGGSGVGLQAYFYDALGTVKTRSMSRAMDYCPQDTDVGWGQGHQNIQKQVAEGQAEIPPDLAQQVFFKWLIDENPDPPYTSDMEYTPRTYYAWAADLAGLLTEERVDGITEELLISLKEVVNSFVDEHEKDILSSLRRAVETLPIEDLADQIRADDQIDQLPQDLVERITALMPLEELAGYIKEEAKLLEVLEDVSGDFVDDLPFQKTGRMIRKDKRILKALQASVPGFSLSEVAGTIRSDHRIIDALARVAAETPVDAVIDFIQDERRSALIGQTMAGTLLNLAADFVVDEDLSTFIQGVFFDAIFDSLGGSPGSLIVDSLAAFLENEDFATYLVQALYELTYGVDYELWNLYRQVVPRFFTYALWKLT